jgi:TonB family protein
MSLMKDATMTNPTKIISYGALMLAIGVAAGPASAGTPAKSVCTVRNADATMRSMTPVDMPALAAIQHLSGAATVQFDLDESGVARNAVIIKSAGSGILDTAALKAAVAQNYAPQIRDCENVGGSYRVIIDFAPDPAD